LIKNKIIEGRAFFGFPEVKALKLALDKTYAEIAPVQAPEDRAQ
jgi:hypothetical protein